VFGSPPLPHDTQCNALQVPTTGSGLTFNDESNLANVKHLCKIQNDDHYREKRRIYPDDNRPERWIISFSPEQTQCGKEIDRQVEVQW